MDAITAGEVIDARYRIESMIGEGGMCKVFRATHLQLQKPVAIKILNPLSLLTRDAVVRFKREAEAVARLSHPNIVEGFGFGTVGERPYMVLEYIQGRSLAALLAERGALDEAEFVGLVRQICAGLQHAHEQGIVHRDLKPSNVVITNDGVVKVVDFGIAQLLPVTGAEMQKLTQTGEVFGTFKYMSPEQCMGRATDARSDVYSLGCMMYEMLTGRTPFDGATSWDVMSKHLSETMPVDASLGKYGGLIRACLAKEPDERPQSVRVVLEGVEGDRTAFVVRSQSTKKPKPKAMSVVPLAAVALLFVCGAIGFSLTHKPPVQQLADPESAIHQVYERAATDNHAMVEDVRRAELLCAQIPAGRQSRAEAMIAAIAGIAEDDGLVQRHVRFSKDPEGSFDELERVGDDLTSRFHRFVPAGQIYTFAGLEEANVGNVTRSKQFLTAAGMWYAVAAKPAFCNQAYDHLRKLDRPGERVHNDLADTKKLCRVGSFEPIDKALKQMDENLPALESRKNFPDLCRCELHHQRAQWLARLERYKEARTELDLSDKYGNKSIAAGERYCVDAETFMTENAKQRQNIPQ